MLSYSIDSSVFKPPSLPKNIELNKKYIESLKEYRDIISNCYNFIKLEGISVYIFYFKNEFDFEYIKEAEKKSGFPVGRYKRTIGILEKISLFNITEIYHGEAIGPGKYRCEDWFGVKIKNYEKSICNPPLSYENSGFFDRINILGILNSIVYRDSKYHYLILKDDVSELELSSSNIEFSIKISDIPVKYKDFNESSIITKIGVLPVKKLPSISTASKFNTIMEVYNEYYNMAKKDMIPIVFGNDVVKGIKTIRETTGPADRIAAYIETLIEFCKYKKANFNNIFPDDYILRVLGCICSYENKNKMQNDKDFLEQRMFDNGNNTKIPFSLHLKPKTIDPENDLDNRKRTVRIYIHWDSNQEKVIVGWIGRHLSL